MERRGNYSLFATPYSPLSNPCRIELRPFAGTVKAKRALLAEGVGPLENPVLPGGEARKDLGFHGLGAYEAQIRFHAGQPVGGKAGALLEKHAHFIIPVDVVEREGDKPERLSLFGIQRLANVLARILQIRCIGLKARFESRQSVAHR